MSKKTNFAKLLVWPESVFPDPFFKIAESRQKVFDFAKKHQIQILFTTIDWDIHWILQLQSVNEYTPYDNKEWWKITQQ